MPGQVGRRPVTGEPVDIEYYAIAQYERDRDLINGAFSVKVKPDVDLVATISG